MVARVVPQSARRRHAESRKPDLWGCAAGGRWPVSAASWRADVASPPLGQSAAKPAAPGARAAQGGRQRARRGRGGQEDIKGA